MFTGARACLSFRPDPGRGRYLPYSLFRRLLSAAFAAALLASPAFAYAEDWRDDLLLRGFAENELHGDSLRGQPLLLQFWESWCRSCGQLMVDMDGVASRFPSVRYVVVSTDENPSDARRRLESHPLFSQHPERFFHDSSRQLEEHFGIATVPTVLVIGADGHERLRHSGHFNSSELQSLVDLLSELDSKSKGSTP